MNKSTEAAFLNFSIEKLDQMCQRIETCLGQLTAEQAWARGGSRQNAVGNLVLHLSGNVRQWILTGVCGEADSRDRDAEFAASGGQTPQELAELLRSTVDAAVARLHSLPHEQLADAMSVQGYAVTKLEGIYHVVEHFSGHAFQIIFVTKMLTGEDLGFYAHLGKPKLAGERP